MAIDRIDWHSEAENYPQDMPYENGGNHIGYFIEYLYKHDFLPDFDSGEHEPQECLAVKNGEKSGLEFLLRDCDGKFWDADTNAEGLEFTEYIYDKYLSNLYDILGHSPYETDYSEEDYRKAEQWLDKEFEEWKK
ncbi:MAG: hypothetical protein LBL82_03850 [Oscillospiraceae bacterium]|jgi:hypothetical protein|nr:hypothetical protein [Oscillospiraceae bacterium]